MQQTVIASATHRFSFRPERVFDAWLDPVLVRKWMSLPHPMMGELQLRRIEIDPRVGGRFLFSDMREEGEAVHWGEYRVIDRPHLLVFTWWTSPEEEEADNSLVTIRIEPDGDGCRVTLEHAMSAEWRDYVESAANAWSGMLQQVEALLSLGN
ncbi:MAG: SRPBCC domain-containing protein [Acidobacteria bacterium]|nr:SRPBCC domain-containing protein [Acidobacteriota bacterium]